MSDSKNDKRPVWVKDKEIAHDYEVIDCASFHPVKDFKEDVREYKGFYVLIRFTRNDLKLPTNIEVSICSYNKKDPNSKHIIHRSYRGFKAQDIYYRLLNDEWIQRLDHAAYLGKELKKAEMSIALGTEYIQE